MQKPISEMKLVELKAHALSLGIEGCEAMKSKAEVILAIENLKPQSKSDSQPEAKKQDSDKKPALRIRKKKLNMKLLKKG